MTPGDYDIASLIKVDVDGKWLYFTASPDNMAQRYLYRAPLDGSGEKERITPEDYSGTNSYEFSDDARHAVHTHSSFVQPPQYRLVKLDGHQVLQTFEDNQELIDRLAELKLRRTSIRQNDIRSLTLSMVRLPVRRFATHGLACVTCGTC